MPKPTARAQHPSSPGSAGAAPVDGKTFPSDGTVAAGPRSTPFTTARNGHDATTALDILWPPELDRYLKEAAESGHFDERASIDFIRQSHPRLPKETIWQRIVSLGLSARKRPPYEDRVWSEVEDGILRARYGHNRSESNAAINGILVLHPTWSRDAIVRRAQVLGLTRHRAGPTQKWTRALDHTLLSLTGCALETITQRLRRSRKSVLSRLRQLGRNADFFGGYKTKDLMHDLNVTEGTVNRWVRLGWLARKKRRITEESLCDLCRRHPEEIPFETLPFEQRNWVTRSMGYRRPGPDQNAKKP